MIDIDPQRKTSGSALGVFLARTLKKLRTDRGMSQEALAEKSGLDRTYISLLERNRKNVTLGTLEKIIPHISTNPVNFFATFSSAIGEDITASEPGGEKLAGSTDSGVGVTGIYCVRLLAQFSDWVASEIRQPMLRVRQALSMLAPTEAPSASVPSDLGQGAPRAEIPAARVAELEASVKEIERILALLSLFSSAAASASGSFIPVKTLVESAAALAPLSGRGTATAITITPINDSITVKGHPAHLIFALLSVINWAITHENVNHPITLEVNDGAQKVQISVLSSGQALDSTQRTQVFVPTFATTGNRDHGTRNLGLCLAKGIFEEHSGSLWIDPSSPQARFVMDLPKS